MRIVCISLAFALFAARPLLAQVVDKKVDCDKSDTITKAVTGLDFDKAYVIHVSGTCKENVFIDNFEGLTLTILGDPSATVQGLTVSPEGQPVFLISNSRRVAVVNLTISTSGGVTPADNPAGVSMDLCRGCQVMSSIINTSRVGIDLTNSQATISDVTINSSGIGSSGLNVLDSSNAEVTNFTAHGGGGGFGVLAARSSRVHMTAAAPGSSSIHDYSVGIQARTAADVEAAAPCNPTTCLEVHDNLVTGVQVIGAQATLNGVNVTNNNQGIMVGNGSVLVYAGPGSITGNHGFAGGFGIYVSHNSHAAVFGSSAGAGTHITGNTGRGVSVASNSSVQFVGAAGMVDVTGNDGAINIACDTSSLITGTGALVPTTISCVDQQVPSTVIP